MAYESLGTGVLFTNSRKQKDSHPDYEGNITIGQERFRIVAWTKTDRSGKTMLSISVNKFESPKTQNEPTQRSPESYEEKSFGDLDKHWDDDIPWG